MPQALLPLIPDGATQVNDRISVVQQQGQWTYFCGIHPVFEHGEEDRASFRMFSAQLVCQGSCRQSEIIQTFGVSKNSVKRSVKKYRDEGIESFFRPRRPRSSNVLTRRSWPGLRNSCTEAARPRRWPMSWKSNATPSVRPSIRDVSRDRRASDTRPPKRRPARQSPLGPLRTSRSAASRMRRPRWGSPARGRWSGWPRPLGLLDGAPTEFQVCRDVSFGGVLCALPALTQNGLFDHLDECFPSLGGYYTTTQIVSLLALMALCQIQTVEQLQYQSPGELGKLLGLDRVPEVRCLRQKLTRLSQNNAPEQWAGRLSRDWLQTSEEWPARCTSTATCGSITGIKRRCRDATWLAKDCVCEAPPATGSTTRWASPRPSNSPPTPTAIASSWSSTAKGTARSSSNRCGGSIASPASATTSIRKGTGRSRGSSRPT